MKIPNYDPGSSESDYMQGVSRLSARFKLGPTSHVTLFCSFEFGVRHLGSMHVKM